MKLDRLTSIAAAAAAVALACGCSSTPAPRSSASAALLSDSAYACQGRSADGRTAADPNVTGTTNLMSAKLPGPAPRVGKAHLAVDDDIEAASTSNDAHDGELDAPKEARRSDGSRRGGGFGSAK